MLAAGVLYFVVVSPYKDYNYKVREYLYCLFRAPVLQAGGVLGCSILARILTSAGRPPLLLLRPPKKNVRWDLVRIIEKALSS